MREPDSPRLVSPNGCNTLWLKQSTNKHVFSAYYVHASILKQYRKYKEGKLLVLALLRLPI